MSNYSLDEFKDIFGPHATDVTERQAIVQAALNGAPVLSSINWSGNQSTFTIMLYAKLEQFGMYRPTPKSEPVYCVDKLVEYVRQMTTTQFAPAAPAKEKSKPGMLVFKTVEEAQEYMLLVNENLDFDGVSATPRGLVAALILAAEEGHGTFELVTKKDGTGNPLPFAVAELAWWDGHTPYTLGVSTAGLIRTWVS